MPPVACCLDWHWIPWTWPLPAGTITSGRNRPGRPCLLELLADGDIPKAIAAPKELYKYMLGQGKMLRGVTDDPALVNYLYEPGSTSYSLTDLEGEFLPAASGGRGPGYGGSGACTPAETGGTGTYQPVRNHRTAPYREPGRNGIQRHHHRSGHAGRSHRRNEEEGQCPGTAGLGPGRGRSST